MARKHTSSIKDSTKIAYNTAAELIPLGLTRNEICSVSMLKGVEVATAITQFNKAHAVYEQRKEKKA